MMNWRDLMAPPPEMLTYPQNPQNPQNRGARGIIAHSADIADRVSAHTMASVSTPPTQVGEELPLSMPPPQAQRFLAKAQGKVREVKRDWSPSWRELAVLSSGLTADDPRLPLVMAALNACDDAYLNGDFMAFCQAAERVRSAVEGKNHRAEL